MDENERLHDWGPPSWWGERMCLRAGCRGVWEIAYGDPQPDGCTGSDRAPASVHSELSARTLPGAIHPELAGLLFPRSFQTWLDTPWRTGRPCRLNVAALQPTGPRTVGVAVHQLTFTLYVFRGRAAFTGQPYHWAWNVAIDQHSRAVASEHVRRVPEPLWIEHHQAALMLPADKWAQS